MKSAIVLILWIISAILVNRIYHKMFHVVYFGANGILKELIVTVIISAMITYFILGSLGNILGGHKNEDNNIENEQNQIEESAIASELEDENDDEYTESFDFEFSNKPEFSMSIIVEKLDYGNLQGLLPDLERTIKNGISKSFNSKFDVESYYEIDDEHDIDELAYATATEEGDAEKRYLEGGVYHSKSDDKIYQYVCFYSENLYGVNTGDITSMKTDIDNALGISISEEKIVQAVEDVYTHTDNMQKDYTLRQEKTINTDKYEETITIVLCGTIGNDGRTCYYAYTERERCYF